MTNRPDREGRGAALRAVKRLNDGTVVFSDNGQPAYDDTPLTAEDLGVELLLAASTLRHHTGDFDWKAIAEEFTKSDIEWLERAVQEIKAHV
jgi:hypothetical protein